MRRMRKNLQMITQDPFASLDPRMDIQAAISEGLRIHKISSNPKELEETAVRMM